MTLPGTEAETKTADGWIQVNLIGGPHDGQTLHVPANQADLTLFEGLRPYPYHRVNDRPEFHHSDRLARLFGGAA